MARQRLLFHHAHLIVGGERAVQIGTQDVGAFHEHDAVRNPAPAKRVVHRVVVVAQAERRLRIPDEQLVADRSGGYEPVVVHQRAHGRPLELVDAFVDHRLRAVRVRDHRARYPAVFERVAECTQRGVVHAGGVLALERLDAEVHEAAVGRDARPLPEDVARGRLAVGLARFERLARERVHGRRAPARTQRRVAAGDGVAAAGGTGHEVADGRLRQEVLEVRHVGRDDVGPRHGRKRQHEHALDPSVRRRIALCGAGHCASAARAGDEYAREQHAREGERDPAPNGHSSTARSGSVGSSACSRSAGRLGSMRSIAT